ncbi:MAG: hypothetical protein OEQ53_18645, partial [Saprospiraceae bacterium]|nr:hypothetical protein [Saprospiraceae bacterium]
MTRKKANKKKNKRRSSSNRASKSTKWALRLSPDLLYILLFVVVVISMHPALILQGKRYGVDDNVVKTITANNVEQDDGTTAYWDPNSWGGIPNVFHLPKTVLSPDFYLRALSEQTNLALVYLLFGAIGMFFLLRYLRFSRPTAVIGVLIFIMVPYYKSLLIVGHIDKFPSIMHIPWIAWFTLRVRDRQSLSNMLLLALILGLQLRANHYQIVFYTGFVVISLLIPSLIQAARQRVFSAIFRKIFTVAGAYLCAVLLAAQPLLATFQLSDNTLRTNTPIDIQRSDQSGAAATRGVDKSFVKTWSWASRDILSLILPRAVGGLTIENYNGQVPGYIDGVVPGYWGSVPFSRTYYYMGALAIFFCIIGIAAHKDQRIVRSLTGLCLLTVLWALGVNAGYFYDLCYNYLPFFKNFRTPITSLAILYFAIAILATFGVNFLLGDSPVSRKIRISNWA